MFFPGSGTFQTQIFPSLWFWCLIKMDFSLPHWSYFLWSLHKLRIGFFCQFFFVNDFPFLINPSLILDSLFLWKYQDHGQKLPLFHVLHDFSPLIIHFDKSKMIFLGSRWIQSGPSCHNYSWVLLFIIVSEEKLRHKYNFPPPIFSADLCLEMQGFHSNSARCAYYISVLLIQIRDPSLGFYFYVFNAKTVPLSMWNSPPSKASIRKRWQQQVQSPLVWFLF